MSKKIKIIIGVITLLIILLLIHTVAIKFTTVCKNKYFYDSYYFYRYDLFGLEGPKCPWRSVNIPN